MKFAALFFLLLAAPSNTRATTAQSLANRVHIDGRIEEYEPDEWVLDLMTQPAEAVDDSRWGAADDIHRVAITWDNTYLYVAAEARNSSSSLLSFVQFGSGGLSDLNIPGAFRRLVTFDTFAPNIVALARLGTSPDVLGVGAARSLATIDEETAPRAFTRFSDRPGAFEMAIPWDMVTPRRDALSFLFAITGDEGSGVGDAAPDPARLLDVSRYEQARLDRVLTIVVDANGDGTPDTGVSPRTIARVDTTLLANPATHVSLGLRPDRRTFAPGDGESLSFSVTSSTTTSNPVFLTCRVFSISGKLIRLIYEDDERIPGETDSRDMWDGRDRSGSVVEGGVYIIHLNWGAARGSTDGNDKAAVAVVR